MTYVTYVERLAIKYGLPLAELRRIDKQHPELGPELLEEAIRFALSAGGADALEQVRQSIERRRNARRS